LAAFPPYLFSKEFENKETIHHIVSV
jgi:hypothetical protein